MAGWAASAGQDQPTRDTTGTVNHYHFIELMQSVHGYYSRLWPLSLHLCHVAFMLY